MPPPVVEDRGLQTKSLDRWERQMAEWDTMASRLAARAGKRVDDVMHNTVHHWRERQEELDYIQASIPQAARATESGWEMSLRDQGDGVRYVRFGSDYPYPLYCPIGNKDNIPPDDNIFMRVIAHNTSSSAKRKTMKDTSTFYRQRGEQYKKHIAKKFAHVQHATEREMLWIVGERPPYTHERVSEEVNAPIQHYECVYEASASGEKGSDHATPAASAAPSKGVSAAESAVPEAAEAEQPREGPLLLIAASRLQFFTEPHDLSHLPLKATNFGSTAIFYSWKPVPNEPIRNSAGQALAFSSERAAMFALAEGHSGVLLPGQEHHFAFSFRSTRPCIASERWELQTVPSGKEPFVLNLRGVTTARERDPLSTQFLGSMFQSKIEAEAARTAERQQAEAAAREAERLEEEARRNRKELSEQDLRLQEVARQWEAANKGEDLSGQESVCRDFLLLKTSVESALFYCKREQHKQLLSQETDTLAGMETAADPSVGTPSQVGETPRPPPHPNQSVPTASVTHSSRAAAATAAAKKQTKNCPKWNGSVALVRQDILRIPYPSLRGEYLQAYNDVLRSARHDHPPGSVVAEMEAAQQGPQAVTRWTSVRHHYAVCREMLLAAVGDIVDINCNLQEGLGLIEPPPRGAGAKGKGAKAPKKAPSKGDEVKMSPEEARALLASQFHSEVAMRLSDMVDQSLLMYDRSTARVEKILLCPAEFVVKHLRGSREPTPEIASRRVSVEAREAARRLSGPQKQGLGDNPSTVQETPRPVSTQEDEEEEGEESD